MKLGVSPWDLLNIKIKRYNSVVGNPIYKLNWDFPKGFAACTNKTIQFRSGKPNIQIKLGFPQPR